MCKSGFEWVLRWVGGGGSLRSAKVRCNGTLTRSNLGPIVANELPHTKELETIRVCVCVNLEGACVNAILAAKN